LDSNSSFSSKFVDTSCAALAHSGVHGAIAAKISRGEFAVRGTDNERLPVSEIPFDITSIADVETPAHVDSGIVYILSTTTDYYAPH
jgi:hypothetical protein